MTGLPPCLVPIAGPLVEIGSVVERVRAGAVTVGEVFGDGDGEGEGETKGEGEGSVTTGCGAVTGATVFELGVAADVSGVCLLMP
jgi:hypothetical protein